jgi:hypothetical protein
MVMNIKQLEPERYDELLPTVVDPSNSVVIVAEDPETLDIKGYWVAQNVVHIEPIWLADEVRSGLTGIKMYAALLAALKQHNIEHFYTFVDKAEIGDYLIRLGLQLMPYVTYKGVVPPIPQLEE